MFYCTFYFTCDRPFRRTSWMSGPGQYNDAGDGSDAAQVDHPDRFLDVEVVEYGAAVNAVIGRLTVDRPGRVTVHPLVLAGVPLVLTTIVDERFLLKRQVLHCVQQASINALRIGNCTLMTSHARSGLAP